MAKTLRTAAFVVGAVALIATGVGAVAGGAGLAALAATAASVATYASLAAGVLSIAATLSTPKGSLGSGTATKFTIDKESGIPIVFGRTYSGGRVVHRQYYGTKNSLESWVTALSIGPVKSVGPLLIDKAAVTFIGGTAQGSYNGFMWLDTQTGACPEPRALAGPQGAIPGWSALSKLSGLAADLWTLKFDTKQKVYPNGVPQRGRVVEGVFAWDPRLDDTVPGGVGACRRDDPSTWPWTENPWLLCLQFGLGYVQNGVLVAGGGLGVTGVDLVRFMEAANYADLVGWKAGGLVFTTTDNSWDILKMLAQAGGGEVMPVGGLLSCTFSAPRVSIGTIRSEDVAGDIDRPATVSMRLRRNSVIPQVRLESHGWEMVPLDAITVADYVAVDGALRPRELPLPLVQSADQGAQLATLRMMDDRELDGIVLPLKVYALGYLPGDALDCDIPEAELTDRQVIVRTREIDAATLGVTLTCRTETPGKHAFALGRTGTPPPTPDLSIPPAYPSDVARAAHVIAGTNNETPTTATADKITITASDVVLDDSTALTLPAGEITGLAASTSYLVVWSLSAHAYSAAVMPALATKADGDKVIVQYQATPAADGTTYPPTTTPPPGSGGGGYGGGGRYQQDVQTQ